MHTDKQGQAIIATHCASIAALGPLAPVVSTDVQEVMLRQEFVSILSSARYLGIGIGIYEASNRVPIFPLLPREASKRVPIFDRGTGSKPEMLRSGSLQADLSLIV